MKRRRDSRNVQALAYLHRNKCASALELGRAAVQGEPVAQAMPWRSKEALGLSIALKLVRQGKVAATRANQFRLLA